MNIIEDNACFRHVRAFPEDAAKDNASLCGRNLDGGFDALEAVRRDSVHSWTLDDLEVSKSCKVEAEILEGVGGLVDEEDV